VNVTRITALAQITLSILFLAAYFTALALFLLGYVQVATVWRDQIGVLLGVLTGGVTTIIAFWFARHRPQQKEEPEHVPVPDGRPPVS